jgi:hypothetical protein
VPGVPTAPTYPQPIENPTINNLSYGLGGTTADPVLTLTWDPVPSAASYAIEVSFDAGATWNPRPAVLSNRADLLMPPEAVRVRVAAFTTVRGPWTVLAVDLTDVNEYPQPEVVTGLALDAAFVGDTMVVTWDAGDTANSWLVTIEHDSTDKYTEEVVFSATPTFTFYHEQAVEFGIGRSFTVKVQPRNASGILGVAATLAVNNPQCAALGAATDIATPNGFLVSMPAAAETDVAGYRVYASQVDGFTADDSTLVYDGFLPLADVALNRDSVPDTYYYRYAAYDHWGTDGLNLSAQQSVSTVDLEDFIIVDGATLAAKTGVIENDITVLQSDVGGNSASITSQSLLIDALEAQYGVELDVNGYITGFVQNNNGSSGSFKILADQFLVVDPGGGGGQPGTTPFAVVSGVVYLDTAYIRDGTLTNAKIANLDAGKVTTGTLSAQRINLDGITLENNGGQLRIKSNGVDTGQLASNAVSNTFPDELGSNTTATANVWKVVINNGGQFLDAGSVSVIPWSIITQGESSGPPSVTVRITRYKQVGASWTNDGVVFSGGNTLNQDFLSGLVVDTISTYAFYYYELAFLCSKTKTIYAGSSIHITSLKK